MNVCNKLECLSPDKPFHPCYMFEDKAGAYELSDAQL